MIKVRQVKIEVLSDNEDNRLLALCKKLKTNKEDILSYEITKQSLDARDKENIYYVYELKVDLKNEAKFLKRKSFDIVPFEDEKYHFCKSGVELVNDNIVIVGSGPAGLFAAYILAENGYKPLIIERGKKVEKRTCDIETFWKTGVLDPNSNVQFGEGGAGTFSDGKLNTLVKDKNNRMKKVFETFVDCGAPKEILYSYKPHIGTDILQKVIVNMRNKIMQMGGRFLYESTVTNLKIKNNQVESIIINGNKEIKCDAVILAIGHSARDTFAMLYENGVQMENKPFAVGLRIQHPQKLINLSQYGAKYEKALGAASYKLTCNINNRGIYSFCMCPGGFVVNASSKEGYLAINGMSNHARCEKNANSAIIMSVGPEDYGYGPLDGVKYQEKLEKKAYELGNGKIPVQLLKDYQDNNNSHEFKSINPVFKGDYTFSNLNLLFNKNMNHNFKEAFKNFGNKIKNFDHPDAILAGIESRTSSPVRIIRDENYESNIKGLYPCGEGAGYAGGITSAAMDGIKIAEAIGKKFQ